MTDISHCRQIKGEYRLVPVLADSGEVGVRKERLSDGLSVNKHINCTPGKPKASVSFSRRRSTATNRLATTTTVPTPQTVIVIRPVIRVPTKLGTVDFDDTTSALDGEGADCRSGEDLCKQTSG